MKGFQILQLSLCVKQTLSPYSAQVVVIKSAKKCLAIFGSPTETEPRVGVFAADTAAAGTAATQFKVDLQKNGGFSLQSLATGHYLTAVQDGPQMRLALASNNAVSTGRVPSSALAFFVVAREAAQAVRGGGDIPVVTETSADALLWLGQALQQLAADGQPAYSPMNVLDLLSLPLPVLDLESSDGASSADPHTPVRFAPPGNEPLCVLFVRKANEELAAKGPLPR